MNDERFAPSPAQVAAVVSVTGGSPPRRVLLAVRLLWIGFLLGLPAFIHVFEDAQESISGVVVLGVTCLGALWFYARPTSGTKAEA